MAPIPSILLAIPSSYPLLSVPGHYTQLLSDASPAFALTSLQAAQVAPELIVLSADVLFKSGLGVLSALKKAAAQSGATLLLVSELDEPLTTWVARATGAYAAVLGTPQAEAFSQVAELLLSECAAAATLRKEAAPQPSPRSNYLPVPA